VNLDRVLFVTCLVFLCGTLISPLAMSYNRYRCRGGVVAGKQIVVNVVVATEHWALDHPERPCPENIQELVAAEYLMKTPHDPWGEELRYRCPGRSSEDPADVSSSGPDRTYGTDDDIHSWTL
jgi:hypothetical protein